MTGYIIAGILFAFLFALLCVVTYLMVGYKDDVANLKVSRGDYMSLYDGMLAQNLMLGEQLKAFEDMKAQQDIIAFWLRENCKRQIAAGLHNGRGIGEVTVGYLQGRMPTAEMLAALPPTEDDLSEITRFARRQRRQRR